MKNQWQRQVDGPKNYQLDIVNLSQALLMEQIVIVVAAVAVAVVVTTICSQG